MIVRLMQRLLERPVPATIVVVTALGVTAWGVAHVPRSVVLFMLFQASVLLLYFARMPRGLKILLTVLALGVLMPVLGTINAYYMEIAIQVGIFVALALGFQRARGSMDWLRRHGRHIEIAGGALLVGIGVLFVTGAWRQFFIPLQRYFARFGWPPI